MIFIQSIVIFLGLYLMLSGTKKYYKGSSFLQKIAFILKSSLQKKTNPKGEHLWHSFKAE